MHDIAVVGLGAMGSAALYHAARAGARVIGIDAHDPPHTLGSTHGHSRIIREAYFEHPGYVPLVRRAYENWAELERRSGRTLFTRTGGLMIGRTDSDVVRGTLASARQHDIAISELNADEITARVPALSLEPDMVGVLEHHAGVLDPEACVSAYLALARELGAEIRTSVPVTSLDATSAGIRVATESGVVNALHVVVAAGAWTKALLGDSGVDLPLVVERQTMHWFEPREHSQRYGVPDLPVTLIEHAAGHYLYFIPDLGHGVKAAIHYDGQFVDPELVERDVSEDDIRAVTNLLGRFMPGLSTTPRASSVCLYTNTPDKHFLFDTLPDLPNVQVISACSGHGFKFASVLGEMAASRALGQSPLLDVSQFRLSRFTAEI